LSGEIISKTLTIYDCDGVSDLSHDLSRMARR
jgi:hypothetical protein